MSLPILTLDDLRKSKPCYDPTRYLPHDWTGTLVDMLDVVDCPPGDRLYVARKCLQLSDRVLRLFAVKAARLAQTYPKNYTPDPRTLAAIQAAEDYANGLIGARVLEEFRNAAYAAAADAAAAYAAYAAADAADAAYAAYAAADAAAYAADAAARRQCQLQLVAELRQLIIEESQQNGEVK